MNVFLYLAVTAVTFLLTAENRSAKLEKNIGKLKRLRIVFAGAFLLMFILSVSEIVGLSGYKFLPLFGLLAAGVSFIPELKVPEKFSGIVKFSTRALLICGAFELFIFNMNSAHLLNSKYVKTALNISSAEVEAFDPVSGETTGGSAVIEFKGLDMPVGTLTICGSSSSKSLASFSIDITDDTNSKSYRTDIAAANVIRSNRRSQTVPCNFSGKVHDLRIRFYPDAGETITVIGITANKPMMLHFSAIRFLLMFIAGLSVYALGSPVLLRRPYSERKRYVRAIAWAFTGILVCGSLFITNMSRYRNPNHDIGADLKSTSGNQISQEIVDAFEKGQLYLEECTNEALLNLENPYDWSQRDETVGGYPWDHLLYDGKIYSYYGIGPVLALFLPYHKLTGYYFPSIWAVWLFGVLGIVFLTKLWLCLSDKFFKKTHGSLILMGLVIMQVSTGIFFNYFDANFYEIAQTSGFLCVTAGAYFLISSGVIGEGKLVNWRLAVSGVFLSMGVLCRPTLAVYCLAAMLFVYAGFRKKKSAYAKGSKAKYYAPYFLCALLPYVLIGLIQMWYNYARFGSFTDFGIQYSLTINDFINAEYHTHLALIGFYSYIIAFPKFVPEFPFFTADWTHTFNPQGYYFVATGATLGLLWRAAPILAYFKFPTAYRLTDNKNKRMYSLLILAVCIACPFAVIYSIWESGYGTRYCVDFAWQLILGALVICFIVYEKSSNEIRRHANSAMITATAVSILMNFIQLYSYLNPAQSFNTQWQANVMSFARLFEFWK